MTTKGKSTPTSKVGKPVATAKKVTHKPPVYPGLTQSPKRHLGTSVPPVKRGSIPALRSGEARKGKTPEPYYNVPEVPGKAHGK
ncbi:MAG: hypothetical protein MUQ30_21120 [Anaerolineae bacterium]|nr:hypothetical protein [Anaerolineae bacterium]